MALRIASFDRVVVIADVSALEAILRVRERTGCGTFWPSHDDDECPVMLILTRSDVATLNYWTTLDLPGFQSRGDANDPGFTPFFLDSLTEETEFPNVSIVPLERAIAAATEFFWSDALPKSICWTEL